MDPVFASQLVHRASVSRQQMVNVDGMPQMTWVVVATGVPCLLDAYREPSSPTDLALASAAQVNEARKAGRLLAGPSADIRAADLVTVTGLGMPSPSKWSVSAWPSPVYSPHGLSHREFRVIEQA